MRVALFILAITTFLVPRGLHAQLRSEPDVPKYEVGLQFDIHHLDGVALWGGGVGGRFHYNFNDHFALDSELTYRQHDLPALNVFSPTSIVVGQTTGLFGIRAGQRMQDVGLFLHARAGFLHFGSSQGESLLTRATVPAVNVGGTIEHYSGPTILRFEVGEMIVAYGSAQVFSTAPSPPPQPGRLGTRASPIVSFGFAFRF